MAVRFLDSRQTLSRFYSGSTRQGPGRTRGSRNPRFCLRRHIREDCKCTEVRDFVVNTFLPWSKANRRTWREDVYRSTSLITLFGKYSLDEISPFLIERFKMKRRQTPTKKRTERRPATVNRELENLSCIFTLAIDNQLLQSNPSQKVRLLSEDNE